MLEELEELEHARVRRAPILLLLNTKPCHSSHAGVLVLEELEHARARGAPILAEYIGGSFTCDAHHMTEPLPDGTGVGRCIAMCALLLILFVGMLHSDQG